LPKHRHHRPAAAPPAGLRPRIERAVAEGRFQQALELARQLHKQEPTPDHLRLLKDCVLGRARQLNGQGHSRDAVATLEAGQRLDPDDLSWLEQLAVELAAAGGARQALTLLERVPGSPQAARVLQQVADAAVRQEAAGRNSLPHALQPDFDRVLQAFRLVEAGQDEPAREALQGIGLRSPFLEWKVFLRGLQAYYAHDDARALENWQRLDAQRLPARLAAPLRVGLDRAFRDAQPHAVQVRLLKQADRLAGSSPVQQMRQLRAALEDKESLAPAFRQAEALLPALKQGAPHLVPRLASCFYWAILDTGPDDVLRYRRVFGAPADDPQLHRVNALAYDRAGEAEQAHQAWLAYEKDLAAHPENWPPGQAERARAHVWLHLGRNAAAVPGPARLRRLPPFLRDDPDRPRALRPNAEQCFTRSIELAPDLLDPYEELFRYHREEEHDAKAEKAARKLLERFPDHAPTLEGLAELLQKMGRHAEALSLLQRALGHNPLDRGLRQKVGSAHLKAALEQAQGRRFAEARQGFEAALSFVEGRAPGCFLVPWAATEFLAGDNARADGLLAQARDKGAGPFEVAFRMLVEVARLKLPKPVKARFDREFKEAQAGPPTGTEAAALAAQALRFQLDGVSYHGFKTHLKKAMAYVERVPSQACTDEQLLTVAHALLQLGSKRGSARLAEEGRRRFPQNPFFPHLQVLGLFHGKDPRDLHQWQIEPLLAEAERLARNLPPDARREALLKDIAERRKMLEALNPFGGLFSRLFESEGDWDDEEFWEDED
jgi:tetratricopeptide (TPR) repeat protein